MFKRHKTQFVASDSSDSPSPLTVLEVAKAYNFPSGKNLDSRKVAVIELGGGCRHADIFMFCDQLGVARPTLKDHSVDWAHNGILTAAADGEVALDLCVIAAICPGVQIHTVYAPNTVKGFADAIKYAVDNIYPDSISISWGAPENTSWASADRKLMDDVMSAANRSGIAVYCAAGDNGSSDGVSDGKSHCDFPASSPFAIACGGTRLDIDSEGKRNLERVWDINDGHGSTGGGVSSVYPALNVPNAPALNGRAVPDISGNADPQSGYEIKCDFIGETVGGTSAVAPLYSALHAILQSYCFNKLGDIKPLLYSAPKECFFDVTEGSNGDFHASEGFDCCTGLGVVDGGALLDHLCQIGLAAK